MNDNGGVELDGIKALAVIALIVGVPFAMFGLQEGLGIHLLQLTGSQTCVDGADQIWIDSTGTNYDNNKAWKVEFSSGCNEKIAGGGGEITQDQLEASDDGNVVRAESGFQMGLTGYKAWFYKEINRDYATNVYDYDIRKFECDAGFGSGWVGGCTEEDKQEVKDWQNNHGSAPDTNAFEYLEHRSPGWLGSDYIVASKAVSKKGEVYEFDYDSGTDFEGEVTLCADGRCGSDQISKDDPVANIESGGHSAEVEWRGSRIGELSNIDYSSIIPVYDSDKGKVIVAAKQNKQDWEDSARNIESCLTDVSLDNPDACAPDDEVHNLMTDQRQVLTDQLGIINGKVQIDDNQIRVVAQDSNAIERPVFISTIDTGWIGIIEQVPKPVITGTQDFSIKEQESVPVEIPVENRGESSGRITTEISCEGPVTGGSHTLQLDSGEERRFSIDVSASSGVPNAYTCEVTATPSDSRDNQDTSQFTVTLAEKSEECNDCVGEGPEDGGGSEVVTPPTDDPEFGGINWVRVLAVGFGLVGLLVVVWFRKPIAKKLNEVLGL